jgi:hypothetical protein
VVGAPEAVCNCARWRSGRSGLRPGPKNGFREGGLCTPPRQNRPAADVLVILFRIYNACRLG